MTRARARKILTSTEGVIPRSLFSIFESNSPDRPRRTARLKYPDVKGSRSGSPSDPNPACVCVCVRDKSVRTCASGAQERGALATSCTEDLDEHLLEGVEVSSLLQYFESMRPIAAIARLKSLRWRPKPARQSGPTL
jgi:hypothetical protein